MCDLPADEEEPVDLGFFHDEEPTRNERAPRSETGGADNRFQLKPTGVGGGVLYGANYGAWFGAAIGVMTRLPNWAGIFFPDLWIGSFFGGLLAGAVLGVLLGGIVGYCNRYSDSPWSTGMLVSGTLGLLVGVVFVILRMWWRILQDLFSPSEWIDLVSDATPKIALTSGVLAIVGLAFAVHVLRVIRSRNPVPVRFIMGILAGLGYGVGLGMISLPLLRRYL
jgi:hypothetical protein